MGIIRLKGRSKIFRLTNFVATSLNAVIKPQISVPIPKVNLKTDCRVQATAYDYL